MTTETVLARRLGTRDAVVIGLGSMIGSGVFVAFEPAARVAGTGLLLGLLLAGAVAYCNATSSAQLAAQYPTSGGSYVYGRERLGPWWGFLAGWGFVVGKAASCAAMALTVAAYAVPGPTWAQRATGVLAVVLVTFANTRGITRTAVATRVLVALTLVVLLVVVVLCFASGRSELASEPSHLGASLGWYGVLQSAGLLFFAFAGYARIATLGEEVRDPARTIPRAVPLALGITVVVYLVVAVALLYALGPVQLGGAGAPAQAAVEAVGAGWAGPVVRIGAVAASVGSLLALTAGVGRTSLAMARTGDLPSALAHVDRRRRTPARAQWTIAAVVALLVVVSDLRGAIGFSSFGVLVYYAVANASAWTQEREHRRWPRGLQIAGLLGCLTLVATLPWTAVVAGLAVFAVGLGIRFVRTHRSATSPSFPVRP